MSSLKTALVLGATGLVGRNLVNLLLQDPRYGEVTCLVRRPLQTNHYPDPFNKLKPVVIDFENYHDYQGYFGVDHVFCCLGTTLKQAGSKQAFRQVDFTLVHVSAQLARGQRAGSFVWISSVGADPKSKNFYLRVKGELDNAILRMPQLPYAAAVKPSLLLGERNDMRLGEDIAQKLAPYYSPLMRGPLKKFRPVRALDVANKMVTLQKW
ncbi:NAD(P)H-binding protein [Alteromonas sp. KUL49]|uniref:NAD(P)H-binding protein n=1 Tax=Alteromonas sp. KUL49 TaxID=2480798 RepID=UPI00102F03F9|nr:NAD(P)H-binding protein [Alteromonas sp. KUL49]TAP34952.1 NAD-dependent epimerase/dehydratase family protein [Alteromonas sp. KUL49]GEA13495.1 oxidoreductase [Alteromonas sp. KUL49]